MGRAHSVEELGTGGANGLDVAEDLSQVRPQSRHRGLAIPRNERVRELFHSTDSMAWSFAARIEGRDGNDVREAVRYAHKVNTQPTQRVLF